MRLYQQSLADLEAQAYASMLTCERYVPTAEEKSRGKWAVVFEKLLSDGTADFESTAHVIPIFGTEHYITDLCWCGVDVDELGTVHHKASQ
jgi:hypothetical protein